MRKRTSFGFGNCLTKEWLFLSWCVTFHITQDVPKVMEGDVKMAFSFTGDVL